VPLLLPLLPAAAAAFSARRPSSAPSQGSPAGLVRLLLVLVGA